MAWGMGDEEARARMATLTQPQLQTMGMTSELAEIWRDFYREVKAGNSDNPSAEGRAELMERARDLLAGES